MEVVCAKCPGNENKDYPFKVLIGNPLICPKCRRSVVKEWNVVLGEPSRLCYRSLDWKEVNNPSKERK